MRKKLMFFMVFSTFFLTMCGNLPESELANPIAGLSCKPSPGSSSQEMVCYYTCPEETVGPMLFEEDPSLVLSKGDFDRRFCGITPQFTSTAPPANPSPSSSPTGSPTVASTATGLVPVTAQDPFLAETVSMCDLGGKLINFRILDTAPELTPETLDVQIAEQETTCYVNPTNPSLLTCVLPNDISFPVQIVVSRGGAVIHDFMYSGLGCAVLTTPTPARTRSYP